MLVRQFFGGLSDQFMFLVAAVEKGRCKGVRSCFECVQNSGEKPHFITESAPVFFMENNCA